MSSPAGLKSASSPSLCCHVRAVTTKRCTTIHQYMAITQIHLFNAACQTQAFKSTDLVNRQCMFRKVRYFSYSPRNHHDFVSKLNPSFFQK